MKLNKLEEDMLAGKCGIAAKWGMEFQVRVGDFFDAPDFVPIRMVQLTSDMEVIGQSGFELLRMFQDLPQEQRRVRTLAYVDARGLDTDVYAKLLPGRELHGRAEQILETLVNLGTMSVHAAANYHSIPPIGFGENCAFSSTPQVIYVNSIQGGRSNFEAGPAGIAAMFTGRVPRYGFHRNEKRIGTHHFVLECEPKNPTEWGVAGAIVGRRTGSYSAVPVIDGIRNRPSILDLNHFGAALASYGSVGMFHMVGITPEAPDADAAFGGTLPAPEVISQADITAFIQEWGGSGEKLDIVVLGAPQLSFSELQLLADLLAGKRVNKGTLLLAFTSLELKEVCVRLGIAKKIQDAGGTIVHGPCFFQTFAREVGKLNGLKRLMTQSAKMANLTAGFDYLPVTAPIEQCVESALAGRVL
jgi:predicted aconitase